MGVSSCLFALRTPTGLQPRPTNGLRDIIVSWREFHPKRDGVGGALENSRPCNDDESSSISKRSAGFDLQETLTVFRAVANGRPLSPIVCRRNSYNFSRPVARGPSAATDAAQKRDAEFGLATNRDICFGDDAYLHTGVGREDAHTIERSSYRGFSP